jgi:hypothetical protein
MGKSGRCYREAGQKNRSDNWSDSKNQSYDACNSVMDIYDDQLDSGNECYDWDYENEDDD